MKTLISTTLALILFCGMQVQGQTDSAKYWKMGGVLNIGFSQTSLTNWAAGGDKALAFNSILSYSANYSKDNVSWANQLDMAYGILKQNDAIARKTDDKIEFSSKYGYKARENFFYTFLLGFKTQSFQGYNYSPTKVKISNILAPAYVIYSLGMDYKPNDKLTIFFSPLTGKTTIVNDLSLRNAKAFGVDSGKPTRTELGAYFKAVGKWEVMKNVNLTSKLELFSNYIDNPQNVDVNWENLLSLKVNAYLNVTINTVLIYDDNILIANKEGKKAPRTQFKEVLSLGLSFKF